MWFSREVITPVQIPPFWRWRLPNRGLLRPAEVSDRGCIQLVCRVVSQLALGIGPNPFRIHDADCVAMLVQE